MPKLTLNLPGHVVARLDADAEALGVSLPAVITADLTRYRKMAEAASPKLSDWQWGLLSHVLNGIEAHRILTGDDALPSGASIAVEIDTWADGAMDDDCLRAGELRGQVLTWSPLTIAGVLMRLRGE